MRIPQLPLPMDGVLASVVLSVAVVAVDEDGNVKPPHSPDNPNVYFAIVYGVVIDGSAIFNTIVTDGENAWGLNISGSDIVIAARDDNDWPEAKVVNLAADTPNLLGVAAVEAILNGLNDPELHELNLHKRQVWILDGDSTDAISSTTV